jgi:hypothetical protein
MGLSSMSDERRDVVTPKRSAQVIPLKPAVTERTHFPEVDQYDEYEDGTETIWPWFAIGGAICVVAIVALVINEYIGWDFMGWFSFNI